MGDMMMKKGATKPVKLVSQVMMPWLSSSSVDKERDGSCGRDEFQA